MMNSYQKSADEKFLFRTVHQTNFWTEADSRCLVEEEIQRMLLGEIWRNLVLGNHSHLDFSNSPGVALFVKHCSDD